MQEAGAAIGQRNLDRFRRDETSGSEKQFRAARFEIGQVHIHEPFDHLSFAVAHPGHVDLPIVFGDAEFFASGEVGSDLRAVDNILARKTGDVRARTADIPSFDNDRPLSFLGLSPGNVFAGLAATEHNYIVLFWCGHEVS